MKILETYAFCVDTPEQATIQAIDNLKTNGDQVGSKCEIVNYSVKIRNPQMIDSDSSTIVEMLDEFHGEDHFAITASWTFPENISTGLTGEPKPTSDTGEYFEILCNSEKGNQIQSIIDKINQWGRVNRAVGTVFQADNNLNDMFPPCLLYVQAFYRDGDVSLTAAYRSHTVAKSYYGDIIGLARLQAYIASETDSGIGSITVRSNSLHYRKKNNEDELFEDMYEELV